MDNDDETLVQYLQEQGCSAAEIDQILAKLNQYDKRAVRDSVFDSIASGGFNLQQIIDDLKQEP